MSISQNTPHTGENVAAVAAKNGRLRGKIAVVTGAACGIGRASALALAREGADIVSVDIAGPVSSTPEVVPATPAELDGTGRLVAAAGRRWLATQLD